MPDVASLEAIYQRRFHPDLVFRRQMWRVLCQDFFQRYVPIDATVMEVGAGYCEFINSIHARQKIAVDLNPDTRRYAEDGVRVLITPATDLSDLEAGTIDIAFASIFFEHLEREDIVRTMREVARVLKPNGLFLILQPNYRYCMRDYWRFFDHLTPLDQYSLAEALEISGFAVARTIARFLPYTTKSRLPKSVGFIKVYLRLPIIWRVFGQQAFVVARPARTGG